MLLESIKLALRTISRNVLRSILTLLGIVIGVAAVIALVTIGNGATSKVTSELSKLGSNMLIARPGAPTQGPPGGGEARTFSPRDVEAIRVLAGIRAMAPAANKGATVHYGGASMETTITGSEPGYFVVQDWNFSAGGPFTDSDMRSGTSKCVIGETVRKELFFNESPLGNVIRLGGL
jgi:putative ABC transport system permease protein